MKLETEQYIYDTTGIKSQRKAQMLRLLSQNVQAGNGFTHVFFAREGG